MTMNDKQTITMINGNCYEYIDCEDVLNIALAHRESDPKGYMKTLNDRINILRKEIKKSDEEIGLLKEYIENSCSDCSKLMDRRIVLSNTPKSEAIYQCPDCKKIKKGL